MNFETLWIQLFQVSHDWTGNLLRCFDLDSIRIVVFVSILLNYLKPLA